MSSPAVGLPVLSTGSLPCAPDMVNMGVNDASPTYPVGMKVNDIFGNSYMYVKFGYTSAQGDAVTYSPAAVTTGGSGSVIVIQPTTATLAFFAGFAMNAVTSGNYGFVQIYGWNQVALGSTTTLKADWLKIANGSSVVTDDVAISGNPPTLMTANGALWFIVTNTSVTSAAPAVNTVHFTSALCAAAF
jgi:hypothetical protein